MSTHAATRPSFARTFGFVVAALAVFGLGVAALIGYVALIAWAVPAVYAAAGTIIGGAFLIAVIGLPIAAYLALAFWLRDSDL